MLHFEQSYCFAESHLQGHHLHQDGEVGEVVAEAHGVVEVPTLTHTALVRPNTSPIAAKHKRQSVISAKMHLLQVHLTCTVLPRRQKGLEAISGWAPR